MSFYPLRAALNRYRAVHLVPFKAPVSIKRDGLNPSLTFDPLAHQLGCTEIALIQTLFGVKPRGYSVPVSYVKAIFDDERLPVIEGGPSGAGGI